MEKLKVKHDHTLTDILKVFILMIFICAPFFAVLFETLYATFNKNSVGAYTGGNENAFYLAVSKIQSESLFNWTLNTGLYTAISTMTTQLGITNASIPVIITYMTFIVIIYVIFDIVLGVFKKITHMFNE